MAEIENVECSIPISDFEQLFAKKDDKEQLAWKQLKTVKYERDIIYFGSRTNISWQVEKDIKFQDELGKKNDDSNKVNFIPQKELIENDIKNQTLRKFTSEIEEKDKLYSQTPKWDGKINDKNSKLPDQRIFKNQKQNWLLDIDPWLAEEEPWKTMEAEEKCFSLKLIPDNILNISEHSKAEKNDTVQKKCEEEMVNKVGKKKIMLQKYLTTQEENLFAELKKEAEKNYHELNKNLLLSGKLNDFERKCCKVYKKNHKCKRLPTKEKQDDDKNY
ncbi:uncharacterized protein LOC106669422 [Cimex lectularius]|uniref:Uncharacterized protein n=1 Tax=Cimex lectularius TaxID=79782 RepID=A0A8I6RXU6_CIMLE|nr:uncharacterized protein LOC106669422 [Cimex lectularius]